MLALVPAMTQNQETQEFLFFRRHGEYPCGAARLSSYLTYSHSDLKMRLLALQSIKVRHSASSMDYDGIFCHHYSGFSKLIALAFLN
eukprot:scaffold661952_cov39-Prasinocladus_malaysianus.AAC.1